MKNKEDKENLRVRLDPEFKAEVHAFLDGRKLSQQDAVEGLFRFAMDLDDELLQSMILGQIEFKPERLRLVLRSMAGEQDEAPGVVEALGDRLLAAIQAATRDAVKTGLAEFEAQKKKLR